MFDLQTTRVTLGVYQRVPPAIWFSLVGITFLSMILVGHLLARARGINWLAILALAIAFSGVLVLILDLDRSGAGTSAAIQFSHQPMIDLQKRIAAP